MEFAQHCDTAIIGYAGAEVRGLRLPDQRHSPSSGSEGDRDQFTCAIVGNFLSQSRALGQAPA